MFLRCCIKATVEKLGKQSFQLPLTFQKMCFRQQWSHLEGKNKQISALGQMITRENNFVVTTNVSFSCFYLSQQITTKEKKRKNEESHITCQKVIFENFSNTEKWRFLVLVMKQLHFKCCDWFYIKSYPPHHGDHANSSHVTHVYHTYTLMAHWPFYCSLLQDTNIKHLLLRHELPQSDLRAQNHTTQSLLHANIK